MSELSDNNQLVVVEWVDSQGDGAWNYLEEIVRDALEERALACTSVGYLIADETDYVVVAGSRTHPVAGGKQQVSNTMQIPRCSITSVKPLIELAYADSSASF